MTRLIAVLLAACFVAPYLGAPANVGMSVTNRHGVGIYPAATMSRALDRSDRAGSPSGNDDPAGSSLAAGAHFTLSAITRQGLVSWVDPKYGRFYLALPYPRGTRARICGAGGCITRTSTDYGPSQRIHPDRIADLSAVDFEYVCAVPRRFGLCNATLTILSRGSGPAPRAVPTAPATDILTLGY